MDLLTSNEKSKLFKLFDSVKDTKENVSDTSSILLVDFYNLVMRSYAAVSTLNSDGQHVGAIVGTLKGLVSAIKFLKPNRCIIIADGKNSSQKRKAIYPEYKNNRNSKLRLNRIYEEISEISDEEESLKKQIYRIIEYFQCLPITFLSVDNVEADDTISFCALDFFKDKNVVIMSTDKDFLQLVSDRIKVWSPIKKKLYGEADVINEYNIHPKNFVIFRSLDGDISDNINGIKGCGKKTIVKSFGFLSKNVEATVDQIFEYSEKYQGKYKIYENVLENKNIVSRNYELMQLKNTNLPTHSQLDVYNILNSPIKKLNRAGFIRCVQLDKISSSIQEYAFWLQNAFTLLDNYCFE
jgi:5'-3' exonuclease